MTSNLPQREAVARIIDPWPFFAWQKYVDEYEARGTDEKTARFAADCRYGDLMKDALSKADQIISSLQDRWRPHPTAEMWRAGNQALSIGVQRRLDYDIIVSDIWEAMLKAAPIPSSLKGSDVGGVGE